MRKSAQKIAKELAAERELEEMDLNSRLTLLKQTTGVREDDVAEYERNEILRRAISGVKKNAAVYEAARLSPKKIYSGVKSKVAGNIRSINKSKQRTAAQAYAKRRQEEEQQEYDGPEQSSTLDRGFSSPK